MLSDGLACFNGVATAGCVHEPVETGGGEAAVERPEFRRVNTILGNIKSALRGTYHAIRPKYAQRCLAEIRVPVQSSFRSARHCPETGLCAAEDTADAGTATQVTLSLRDNQET